MNSKGANDSIKLWCRFLVGGRNNDVNKRSVSIQTSVTRANPSTWMVPWMARLVNSKQSTISHRSASRSRAGSAVDDQCDYFREGTARDCYYETIKDALVKELRLGCYDFLRLQEVAIPS